MNENSARGVLIPRILLPGPGVDLIRWAVIACDQFTSEPEYWQQVAGLVGAAPSALNLILPEAYLGAAGEGERISSIHSAMQDYLQRGIFVEREGIVLVERRVAGKTRHGIMLALDLEQYDYGRGSTSLIRATEGTILERIPPRVRIRSGAPLELPHIMVLIDDPQRTVIEPLVAAGAGLRQLYDFDLMLDSGHLSGWLVEDRPRQQQVLAALRALEDPQAFAARYQVAAGRAVLAYAMGDGNHSLATAKAIWEQVKPRVGMDHAARHALVEIENIHDAGLAFEPILRVVFDVRADLAAAIEAFYPGRCRFRDCRTTKEMQELVDGRSGGAEHAVGVIAGGDRRVMYVSDPPSNLPVGTLQGFLDAWGERGGYGRIDYVHGVEVAERLGSQPGNLGFYLPAISKADFFKTVIVDGALPRKTFSMGEAREKRFYMEARRIA